MERESYEIVIVGAGVVGCAIAYHLARSGLRIALIDRGTVASEASLAGAGMLAPLAESGEVSEQRNPFLRLCPAGLHCFNDLDRHLKDETGIDIELVNAPTLRPAFEEHEAEELQVAMSAQQHLLPGVEWLEGSTARKVVYGVLTSSDGEGQDIVCQASGGSPAHWLFAGGHSATSRWHMAHAHK